MLAASVLTRSCRCCLAALLAAAALSSPGASAASLANALDGDFGPALFLSRAPVRGLPPSHQLLPYAYFDYGRFYGRVDTFGARLMPLADGYLEIAGRVSTEGYRARDAGLPGIGDRSTPIPIGIGSLQQTPYGAVFLYALHDLESSGTLLEATYAAEYDRGRWSVYPQLGVERRSAAYVAHLYGVSPQEAQESRMPAYAARSATNVMLGLAAEVAVSGPWKISMQWQHKWLGAGIADSPVVSRRTEDLGFVAVVFHAGRG